MDRPALRVHESRNAETPRRRFRVRYDAPDLGNEAVQAGRDPLALDALHQPVGDLCGLDPAATDVDGEERPTAQASLCSVQPDDRGLERTSLRKSEALQELL